MQDLWLRKNEMRDVGYIYKLAQLADQIGGTMSLAPAVGSSHPTTTFASGQRTIGGTSLAAHEVRQVRRIPAALDAGLT